MPRRKRSRDQLRAIHAALRARQQKSRSGLRTRRLTPGEEQAVYDSLSSKNESERAVAKQHLVTSHSALVSRLAVQFKNRGMDYRDLVQEGQIGLIKAADSFDPKRGTKFSTHAYNWIKQSMGRAVEESGQHIRTPAGHQWILNKVRKINQEFYQRTGRDPSHEETAYMLNMKPEALQKSLDLKFKTKSTDTPIGYDEDRPITLLDGLTDDSETTLDQMIHKETSVNKLQRLQERIQKLTPLEREVISRNQESGAKIGRDLKLSRARISQIKKQAMDKLRNPEPQSNFIEKLKNLFSRHKRK